MLLLVVRVVPVVLVERCGGRDALWGIASRPPSLRLDEG
ncbi:hypothetical protein HNR14_001732 [Leifsonia naganoensis]|uniref:Uncharacterized protein n=1 Tax=Leifsonia naganoensis TaxID=150025 RepID=A0A853DTW1_9MICO|nr:hypothetical protein [Leifsonia naganoensis]